MEGYAFVTKEPLLGPVVLALRVDVPGRKEQLWLGEEQDVEAALRGKERPLFLAPYPKPLFRLKKAFFPPKMQSNPFGPVISINILFK